MPGTLTFPVDDTLRAIIKHTMEAKEWRGAYGGPAPTKPGLFLVKDRGAYLMAATVAPLPKPDGTKGNVVAYAKECPPGDHEAGQAICGGDDFAENLDAGIFAQAVALGMKEIKIKVTAKGFAITARGKAPTVEPEEDRGAMLAKIKAMRANGTLRS